MKTGAEVIGTIERQGDVVSRHFERTLRAYLESGYLPSRVENVLSAACGTFPEAAAISNVFPEAVIEGVDLQTTFLELTQKDKPLPENVTFRNADLSKPKSFRGPYDLIIVRNPDLYRSYLWQAVFENMHKNLRNQESRLMVTTDEDIAVVEETLKQNKLRVVVASKNPYAVSEGTFVPFHDYFVVVAKA